MKIALEAWKSNLVRFAFCERLLINKRNIYYKLFQTIIHELRISDICILFRANNVI